MAASASSSWSTKDVEGGVTALTAAAASAAISYGVSPAATPALTAALTAAWVASWAGAGVVGLAALVVAGVFSPPAVTAVPG